MSINFATKNIRHRGTEDGITWLTADAPIFGAVNGYVKLPAGHPWRDMDLQMGEVDVPVHGGITYGPDESGWIGFDTLHSGDYWPDMPDVLGVGRDKTWTLELVAAEAQQLARHAAAVVLEEQGS